MAEVLKVEYLKFVWKVNSSCQCDGCARIIRNAFRSYPGVCKVEVEGGNVVKVVAMKNVDAVKLLKQVKIQLKEKLNKKVEIISLQTQTQTPPSEPTKKKVVKLETSSGSGPEVTVKLSAGVRSRDSVVCSSVTIRMN